MTIEERIKAMEAEIEGLKAQALIQANGIDHWPDEKAGALGEELGWERPRLYNGLQTPFSATIRSTLLGEEYRRRRLGKLTSEEKAAAVAMWDELADVVRRHAQAVQNKKDRRGQPK